MNKRRILPIIAIVLALAAVAPAKAEGVSTPYAMGGSFTRFDPVVVTYNRSGEAFRITGHCQSACTIFLGIKNVCIEPSARLLFHAGKDNRGVISARVSSHMLGYYNASLRAYVTANHYMDTLAFHTISGRDIIDKFGYRACPAK